MTQYIDKSALVAEIARQKAQWRICKSSEAKYRREMLDDISSFIDTLEVKDLQEESVSEDLEQKALSLFPVVMADKPFTELDLNEEKRRIYKAGAKWQKEKDNQYFAKKTIETLDKVFEDGRDNMKQQMIDKACKYIQEHREEVETEDNGISGWISDEFIEKFKKTMKGE